MAFLKESGKGCRLVADFSSTNGQCELVPGPMRNPEIEGEKCAGAVAFLRWTAFKVTGSSR